VKFTFCYATFCRSVYARPNCAVFLVSAPVANIDYREGDSSFMKAAGAA
jgi:hypothetical protein